MSHFVSLGRMCVLADFIEDVKGDSNEDDDVSDDYKNDTKVEHENDLDAWRHGW